MNRSNENPSRLKVALRGGLGNQLFQLCAAIACTKRTGRQFILDLTPLRVTPIIRGQRRRGEIAALVKPEEILSPAMGWLTSWDYFGDGCLRERDPRDAVLNRISISTKALLGYFQNIALVNEVWTDLLKRIESSPKFSVLTTSNRLSQIAVHVRCGDYLRRSTQRHHGLTASTYYFEALQEAISLSGLGEVRIVSDDPETAKSILDVDALSKKFRVSYSQNASSLEDLRELASSSVVIMNNSSFSWWGAFVANKTHGSTVIAPKPWFAIDTGIEDVLLDPQWKCIRRQIEKI